MANKKRAPNRKSGHRYAERCSRRKETTPSAQKMTDAGHKATVDCASVRDDPPVKTIIEIKETTSQNGAEKLKFCFLENIFIPFV
ncbi:hypothetical protein LC612_29810 [Nostoc sp. CHAB 5834]|nr:hypothetical protein [Nostoc sp. CHAB 5834]